jgi:hypothetical protein
MSVREFSHLRRGLETDYVGKSRTYVGGNDRIMRLDRHTSDIVKIIHLISIGYNGKTIEWE